MKLILTLILLLLTTYAGMAQPSCSFLENYNCTSDDEGDVIARDKDGNVYVAGLYEGDMPMGASTFTSKGGKDVFIAKYNANGVLQWAKTGGSSADETVGGITTDAAGNVYITGSYGIHVIYPTTTDTAYFDNESIVSKGKSDIFLAKYDVDGGLIWLKGYGTEYRDFGKSIICTHAQKIILGGEFSYYAGSPPITSTIYFDSLSATSAGDADIYMVSMDTDAHVNWLKRYGINQYEYCNGLQVDAMDNIYMTGMFDNDVQFPPYTITSISSGFVIGDCFIAKFSSSGTTLWAKAMGGGGGWTSNGGSVHASKVAVTTTGSVYVTGYYGHCTMKFHNGAILPYEDQDQIFLVKYTSNGAFAWARNMGGYSWNYALGLYADENQNIYATGGFQGTAFFDTDTVVGYGGDDAFVTKYDSAGNEQWVINAGGNGNDWGNDITGTPDGGALYITGAFSSSVFHFGTQTISNNGGTDMYIAMLTQPNTGVANNNKEYEVQVYPNPTTGTIYITTPNKGYAQAVLYDVTGREVMKQSIDAEKTIMQAGALTNGVYYLQLSGERQRATEKVIIQH